MGLLKEFDGSSDRDTPDPNGDHKVESSDNLKANSLDPQYTDDVYDRYLVPHVGDEESKDDNLDAAKQQRREIARELRNSIRSQIDGENAILGPYHAAIDHLVATAAEKHHLSKHDVVRAFTATYGHDPFMYFEIELGREDEDDQPYVEIPADPQEDPVVNSVEEPEAFDEGAKGKRKKKSKSKPYPYGAAGWNKAEQHIKYDPPGTNYGKNISARRGFVGEQFFIDSSGRYRRFPHTIEIVTDGIRDALMVLAEQGVQYRLLRNRQTIRFASPTCLKRAKTILESTGILEEMQSRLSFQAPMGSSITNILKHSGIYYEDIGKNSIVMFRESDVEVAEAIAHAHGISPQREAIYESASAGATGAGAVASVVGGLGMGDPKASIYYKAGDDTKKTKPTVIRRPPLVTPKRPKGRRKARNG